MRRSPGSLWRDRAVPPCVDDDDPELAAAERRAGARSQRGIERTQGLFDTSTRARLRCSRSRPSMRRSEGAAALGPITPAAVWRSVRTSAAPSARWLRVPARTHTNGIPCATAASASTARSWPGGEDDSLDPHVSSTLGKPGPRGPGAARPRVDEQHRPERRFCCQPVVPGWLAVGWSHRSSGDGRRVTAPTSGASRVTSTWLITPARDAVTHGTRALSRRGCYQLPVDGS
jgi:hypothetical protein